MPKFLWPASLVYSSMITMTASFFIIGNENQFSDGVIDYALDMARQMSFELIKDEAFSEDVRKHMVYVSSIIYFF